LRLLKEVEPGEPGVSALRRAGGRRAHRGPYAGLAEVYPRLHDWIHAQGHDEGQGPWDPYLDNPDEVDPASVRTEVICPVAE
jgi:effector-binding domain-containing protein